MAASYFLQLVLLLGSTLNQQLGLTAMVVKHENPRSIRIRLVLKNLGSAPMTLNYWTCMRSKNFTVVNPEMALGLGGNCIENRLTRTSLLPQESMEYLTSMGFKDKPNPGLYRVTFVYHDENKAVKPVQSQPLDIRIP